MHITSKGLRLDKETRGFQCTPHEDKDAPMEESNAPQLAQCSMGVWWPIGPVPRGPTFGYPGYMLDLTRPVAAVFNSAHEHFSCGCLMPAGTDVIGTSTEISNRDLKHCLKRD